MDFVTFAADEGVALAARCIDLPVGRMWITASETALVSVGWTEPECKKGHAELSAIGERGHSEPAARQAWLQPQERVPSCLPRPACRREQLLDRTEKQLREYFALTRREFELPLSVEAGTPFQRLVWDALRQIPYGQTRTYGQIAAQIGRPTAARAVGGACNRNPLAIVTPCHRVVGSSGALTGFAGGIDNKKALLSLECGVFC